MLSIDKHRVFMTAAAIPVFLAACSSIGSNSGGGNIDANVVSNGQPTTKANALAAGVQEADNINTETNDNVSSVAATGSEEISDVTIAAPKTLPISAAGVRIDVLVTMLDQQPCKEPSGVHSWDGKLIIDGREAQKYEPMRLVANERLTPFNYRQKSKNNPSHGVDERQNNVYCAPDSFEYKPASPGNYTLIVYSHANTTHDYLNDKTVHGLNEMRIEVPFTLTADSLISSNAIGVGIGDRKRKLISTDEHTSRHTPVPIYHGIASYGLLKQWGTQAGNLVKMMILRGDSDKEAKLCWNVEQPDVRRQQCTVWRAPAGWQRGQQLQVVDQYIIDDRSFYQNETGFAK